MEKVSSTICIIGAGFSGICAAVQLQKSGFENVTLFDKNHDFGGTWLTHTYPNCGAEIPNILYSFSFEPNQNWSSLYCGQPEILHYLQSIADKYKLRQKAKFNCQIRAMTWSHRRQSWKVSALHNETGELEEHFFDFIIAGPGPHRSPQIPEIYKTFTGPLVHCSNWDPTLPLDGKAVAVVGSSATAVQIIPAIVDKVGKLYAVQRDPCWLLPKPKIRFGAPSCVLGCSGCYKCLRFAMFWFYEMIYGAFRRGTWTNGAASCFMNFIRRRACRGNEEAYEKLTPKSPLGTKHASFSSDYYTSMTRNNTVDIIKYEVDKVEDKTISFKNGKNIQVDVIILATGYESLRNFFEGFELFVEEDEQNTEPKMVTEELSSHYLGIMNRQLPNLFMMLGPNTLAFHNSAIFPIECQANWIVKLLTKMRKKKYKVAQVKKSAVAANMRAVREGMKKMAYGIGEKTTWFFGESGFNNVLTTETAFTYWRRTRVVRMQDLELSE